MTPRQAAMLVRFIETAIRHFTYKPRSSDEQSFREESYKSEKEQLIEVLIKDEHE